MTHRFPHDFWAERELDLPPRFRFDGSRTDGMIGRGPLGFSRGTDWDSLIGGTPQEELIGQFIDETVLDEIEFDEEPLDESCHACLTEELHPSAGSTGLFIPEKYEPNYPYPLILWFHDSGRDESDLLTVMPGISERNYFGLSLRGSVPFGPVPVMGFDWSQDSEGLVALEQDIYHTVCELRRNFHIHSERIFLAGQGSGANTALRLLLNRPEWFAGAFGLNAELPIFDPKGTFPPDLRDRRVFLTTPQGEDQQPNLRLWRAAGLRLTSQVEGEWTNVPPERQSQLNHWVMESICAPV
ncbi:MAG: hypothetical protein KDA84_09095 [Planctomycetaceae bacterium]|nr:hypothetical protein [Planctomycetaceae bacterium]